METEGIDELEVEDTTLSLARAALLLLIYVLWFSVDFSWSLPLPSKSCESHRTNRFMIWGFGG